MSTEPKLDGLSEETARIPTQASLTTEKGYALVDQNTTNVHDSHRRGDVHDSLSWRSAKMKSGIVWGSLFSLIGCTLCFLLATWMGSESLLYTLLKGEGSVHAGAQACTLLLFFGGLGVLTSRIIEVKSAAYQLRNLTYPPSVSSELSPVLFGFVMSIHRGLRSAQGELEIREVTDTARDRALEEIEVMTRAPQAIMWLLPLSGFLGTVIGMSRTIGRCDQLFMKTSQDTIIDLVELAPAIKGLSTAFDTTLLALSLVIPLKLALVFLEGLGERLVIAMERDFAEPRRDEVRSRGHQGKVELAELQQRLERLDQQSDRLAEYLKESASFLYNVNGALAETHALSSQNRERLVIEVTHLISEAIDKVAYPHARSVGGDHELTDAVRSQHRQLSIQLEELRQAIEAPLIVSRSSTSTKRDE